MGISFTHVASYSAADMPSSTRLPPWRIMCGITSRMRRT